MPDALGDRLWQGLTNHVDFEKLPMGVCGIIGRRDGIGKLWGSYVAVV